MRVKDESKIAKIQEATAAIILKDGAAAVSTVKVAKAVGISQSNVYLYFKNKDALLLSVYQRELAQIEAAGELTALTTKTQPLAVRLRQYVKAVYDHACAHPDSLQLIQQIKMLMGSAVRDPLSGKQSPHHVVQALIQEAIDAGVLRPLPINVYMAMVFAVIKAHTENMARGAYPPNAYDFEQVFQLLWHGMQA